MTGAGRAELMTLGESNDRPREGGVGFILAKTRRIGQLEFLDADSGAHKRTSTNDYRTSNILNSRPRNGLEPCLTR
jgi:hypothetical protein